MTVPAISQYRCLNCPTKPVFVTKEQLFEHWRLTHTANMIETVETVSVLGTQMSVPKVTIKLVEGPDI